MDRRSGLCIAILHTHNTPTHSSIETHLCTATPNVRISFAPRVTCCLQSSAPYPLLHTLAQVGRQQLEHEWMWVLQPTTAAHQAFWVHTQSHANLPATSALQAAARTVRTCQSFHRFTVCGHELELCDDCDVLLGLAWQTQVAHVHLKCRQQPTPSILPFESNLHSSLLLTVHECVAGCSPAIICARVWDLLLWLRCHWCLGLIQG